MVEISSTSLRKTRGSYHGTDIGTGVRDEEDTEIVNTETVEGVITRKLFIKFRENFYCL